MTSKYSIIRNYFLKIQFNRHSFKRRIKIDVPEDKPTLLLNIGLLGPITNNVNNCFITTHTIHTNYANVYQRWGCDLNSVYK